jgi:putative phosphoribosyl transferase
MFADRRDAGRRLAMKLAGFANRDDVVVVGLPRGGVPVAREVATLLAVPLDVIVVRKLGDPSHPEYALGAIGEHGVRIVDDERIRRAGVDATQLAELEARERAELDMRAHRLRHGRPSVCLKDRVVIVVDDGIATGSTASAACRVARDAGARRVVLATPVAPVDWEQRLEHVADEFVAVETPEPFGAVGCFYDDFSPTDDDEVIDCLRSVALQQRDRPGGPCPLPT